MTAADTTPEHEKNCLALWDRAGGFYNAGPFTPFLYHEEGAPPKTTIQFPGNGGTNWGGPAGDPTLGYIYAFTQDAALTGWVEKKRAGGNYGSGNGSPQPYDRGSITGPGPYSGFSASMGPGLPQGPCQRPPWGRLTAVNAATGDFAWQITLGVTDGLPPEKQNTGRGGSAGPIVTAGGLVFIGTTADAAFPRDRLEDRQGVVRDQTERHRNCHADDVSGEEREAVRRSGRCRHTERVRVAELGSELAEHALLPCGGRVDGVEREHVKSVHTCVRLLDDRRE